MKFLFKDKLNQPDLPGEEHTWQNQGHRIVYSVLGEGEPLLLVHGINAAAWGFEYRHNLAELAKHYKVYLPDLPGFGRSERKRMRYTAELNISFIGDFTEFIYNNEQKAPLVIANSLSAAHVISAVSRKPELFSALVLNCPTGLGRLDFEPQEKFHKLLMSPFGSGLFWLLGTRLSTRIFLQRDGYKDAQAVDHELIEGYHWAVRQPMAKYAPIAFISGMFNHGVKGEWEKIQQPVMITWGRDAKITPLEDSERFVYLRPQTELKVLKDSRLSVQDEQPAEFNQLVLNWFKANKQDNQAVKAAS
jgi:pimeloyl-ACP methyl ester carboxylesterase